MRILIVSDIHLTNKFNKQKFDFLSRIINSADKVILNGDIWDSWFTDFDHFVNSKWNCLFPLLLAKRTVYIYGNHDSKKDCDSRIKLFSVFADNEFVLKSKDQTFLITHGDVLLQDTASLKEKLYNFILKKTDRSFAGDLVRRLIHLIEWIGFKILGPKHMNHSSISQKNNSILKNKNRNTNQWLVCGHTHCAQINQRHRFANSGSIDYGFASYLMINNGVIKIYKKSY